MNYSHKKRYSMATIPVHLTNAVETLAGTIVETRQRISHAERVGICLLGLSALVLREQGFRDAYIGDRLGTRPKAIADGVKAFRVLYRTGRCPRVV